MIHFANPEFLALLLLLPVVAWWVGRQGRIAAVEFSSTSVVREMARKTRSKAGRVVLLFSLLGAACLIVGMARPQRLQGTSEIQASGIDLILAIDVSGSMQSLDFIVNGERASKIDTVKGVVSKFIDARPDDRIGLIEFSGAPYLISPLTLDHDWLRQGLDRVQTGTIADGTAIGDALAMSVNRLRNQPSKSKIVILLTDGVNNMGKLSPELAAEAAKALGVKVYTIGAGVRGEAPMPVKDEYGQTHLVMVKSDVDEATLSKIADLTGGKFFRATDTESLKDIYNEIDHMEKTTRKLKRYQHVNELFAWAVVPGLVVLALGFAMEHTRYRRLP